MFLALASAQVRALENESLDEASGMETRRQGGFWLIEDSGNMAELFAVAPDGGHVGRVGLQGVVNHDWEDLSAYVEPSGRRMLLIADTGDNDSERPNVLLSSVPEDLAEQGLRTGSVPIDHMWDVRLPRGAADIEAVAVEPGTLDVYLLTKRESPPMLWRFNLLAPAHDLELVGAVPIPEPTQAQLDADPRYGYAASWPTAMDFTADGGSLVVQTYTDAWRIPRDEEGELALGGLVNLPVEKLVQTEAACASEDDVWWVTTEQRPSPLLTVPLSTPPQR